MHHICISSSRADLKLAPSHLIDYACIDRICITIKSVGRVSLLFCFVRHRSYLLPRVGVEADVHIHPWKVLCVVCIGFAIQIVYWSVLNLIILQRISVILYLLEHLCSLFVLLQMCVCECVCACVRACVRVCACVCARRWDGLNSTYIAMIKTQKIQEDLN